MKSPGPSVPVILLITAAGLLAAGLLFFSSPSSDEKRPKSLEGEDLRLLRERIQEPRRNKQTRQPVHIGMTKQHLLDAAGAPREKRTTLTDRYTIEVWHYNSGHVITMVDGRVHMIEISE